MRKEARYQPQIIDDEMRIVRRLVETRGRHIADVGCGSGAFACRLALEDGAASVTGIDLPATLPVRGAGTPRPVRFVAGQAPDLPLGDGEVDIVFMMKSLHHVPAPSMDAALEDVARVLRPNGVLYVSEPVAEGNFNAIIRHFHDEADVRRRAQQALDRCTVLGREADVHFLSPCHYRGFDDFERRMMHSNTVTTEITDAIRAATLETYSRFAASDGSFFENRPFHVTVLRKPGA